MARRPKSSATEDLIGFMACYPGGRAWAGARQLLAAACHCYASFAPLSSPLSGARGGQWACSSPEAARCSWLSQADAVPVALKEAPALAPVTKTPARRSSAPKKERGVEVGLDRFEKILRLARRRNGATMEDLKHELEVSLASVKRDIEFLGNRMGCPIDWDPKRHR